MRKKIKIRRDERGVSPVIGVILMVAATVMLAGLVMAMLGGFAPREPARIVSFTAERENATAVRITYMGGPDHDMVNTTKNYLVWINGGQRTGLQPRIGDSKVFSAPKIPSDIVVAIYFLDGTRHVVLNTRV